MCPIPGVKYVVSHHQIEREYSAMCRNTPKPRARLDTYVNLVAGVLPTNQPSATILSNMHQSATDAIFATEDFLMKN